jgi:hypothetical protein
MAYLTAIRAGLVAVFLTVLIGIGWGLKGALNERQVLRQQVASQQESLKLATRHQQVTSKVITKYVQAKSAIKETTKYVTVEIEKRIPADACVLPPDWGLLHNNAATGDLSVPPPTGGADAAPVASKEALGTITENYGAARENAAQLEALQQWINGVTK